MSVYRLTKFGDEILPRFNADWDMSPAPALPAVRTGFAGPFDALPGVASTPGARMVQFSGVYVGDPPAQLVDENGADLVDENGDLLIIDRSVDLQVERLTRMIGQTQEIERLRLADGTRHYLRARLLSVDFGTGPGDGDRLATVAPRFEAAQAAWRSATRKRVSATIDMSSSQRRLEGQNAGLLAARQAIVSLTFERRGTSFELSATGGGGTWHWRLAFDEDDPSDGTWQIDAGEALLVFGPAGVENAYSRWSFGDEHSVQPAVWIPAGAFRLQLSEEVDTSNTGQGDVDISVEFYEEYP